MKSPYYSTMLPPLSSCWVTPSDVNACCFCASSAIVLLCRRTDADAIHLVGCLCSIRSLPSGTLLSVLRQMCHVWITYGIVSGSVQAADKQSIGREESTILDAFRCLLMVLCSDHLQDVYYRQPDKTRQNYTWNHLSHA